MTIATKLNALTSSMMSYSQDVISSWWAVLINNYLREALPANADKIDLKHRMTSSAMSCLQELQIHCYFHKLFNNILLAWSSSYIRTRNVLQIQSCSWQCLLKVLIGTVRWNIYPKEAFTPTCQTLLSVSSLGGNSSNPQTDIGHSFFRENLARR